MPSIPIEQFLALVGADPTRRWPCGDGQALTLEEARRIAVSALYSIGEPAITTDPEAECATGRCRGCCRRGIRRLAAGGGESLRPGNAAAACASSRGASAISIKSSRIQPRWALGGTAPRSADGLVTAPRAFFSLSARASVVSRLSRRLRPTGEAPRGQILTLGTRLTGRLGVVSGPSPRIKVAPKAWIRQAQHDWLVDDAPDQSR